MSCSIKLLQNGKLQLEIPLVKKGERKPCCKSTIKMCISSSSPPKNFARDDKLAFQEWQDILQIDLHYPSVILPYHYKMKNEVRNFALANKNHLRWGCMVTKYPHFERENIRLLQLLIHLVNRNWKNLDVSSVYFRSHGTFFHDLFFLKWSPSRCGGPKCESSF